MELIVDIRHLFAVLLAIVAAYIAPIQDTVFVIFFLFIINCFVGMLAGFIVNDEHFNFKKFFHCLVEALVYFALISCISVVGTKMHNLSGAMQCISGVVYTIIYFYSVNIMKNLKLLFPTNKTIKFIYYVISFEMIKRIPYLQQFTDDDNNKK
jgi:hypothetical protein